MLRTGRALNEADQSRNRASDAEPLPVLAETSRLLNLTGPKNFSVRLGLLANVLEG